MNEPRYRFGIVTTAALGNGLRYKTLRKYTERVAASLGVECFWSLVQHFRDAEPLSFLPNAIKKRLAAREQMGAVRDAWKSLDAVLFHFNEPFALEAVRRTRRGTTRPVLFWAGDAPPNADPDNYPVYIQKQPRWQQKLRLAVERYCADRTDHFLPWSQWAAQSLADGCGVEPERMTVIPQYLDLETWTYQPFPQNAVPRILFVGGDFERKGGHDLLEVFAERFAGRAELHLVTREKGEPAPGVFWHTGLTHGNELQALYASADVFVLPTRADFSPAVVAEAMATGRVVVATAVGGVGEMVSENTGLVVPPRDKPALAAALETLLGNPDLRKRMGDAGRERAVREFGAESNARRMLEVMIGVTNAYRAASTRREPGQSTEATL